MTDRLNGVLVIFDRDIREDDAEAVINAIRCLKYVLRVKPNVSNITDTIALTRARAELQAKLWKALEDE